MVGVLKFSAPSINSNAVARSVPHSVVLATEPLVIGPACTVQVPSWDVKKTLMSSAPSNSRAKFSKSLTGIQHAPKRASISVADKSSGWTDLSAATFS